MLLLSRFDVTLKLGLRLHIRMVHKYVSMLNKLLYEDYTRCSALFSYQVNIAYDHTIQFLQLTILLVVVKP